MHRGRTQVHDTAMRLQLAFVGVGVGIGIGIGFLGSKTISMPIPIPIPTPKFAGFCCYFRDRDAEDAEATRRF